MGKQMTVRAQACAGAPIADSDAWDAIDWRTAKAAVYRLQVRIAKAYRAKQYGKVKSLQWLLAHSFYAKCLAVKRVVQNRGAKTPGVDKVTWKTPKQKLQAVYSLRRRHYKASPLRRIYIPKKTKGKLRPLSIPVMRCRAMQALHLLALEPIAEIIADNNAYGFRPLRSTHDAIAQCFSALAKRGSAHYILEADIQSCFDNISHEWLLKNIPMDKRILENWLRAGYIENGKSHPTESGTPQGGTISATLLVITLGGLETAVKTVVRDRKKNKVYFSIYADDFIITGATREVLEERVKPIVEDFLSERGLMLSKDKTKITHITEGFDFLGVNIRKYRNGKLIMKPAKASVKTFLADIRQLIKSNRAAKTENLIHLLNLRIRGWTNYHRYICAKQTFGYVRHHIFWALWRWAIHRHPNKGKPWVKRKYFRQRGTQSWVFSARVKAKHDSIGYLDLFDVASVEIRRHIKVKSDAVAYNPAYTEYFNQRTLSKSRCA